MRIDTRKQGNNLRKVVTEVGVLRGGLRSFAATGSFAIKKQSIFAIPKASQLLRGHE